MNFTINSYITNGPSKLSFLQFSSEYDYRAAEIIESDTGEQVGMMYTSEKEIPYIAGFGL